MKRLPTFMAGLILGSIITGVTIGQNSPGKTPAAGIAAKNYMVAQLDEITSVPCPCGTSRRAFASPENPVATIHLVNIKTDSQVHYHKKLTEIYLVLEGTGHMELDGASIAVKPMSTIMIKPGCRHRAVGKLNIVNTCLPAFDPKDEWFD
jgi:mannose-6-phosphate isomerase-like protein (cupin superfamily)